MKKRPPYFDLVQRRAQANWAKLEADADLAGPWHQMFRQVQSPRHVLSELLQNADDAGATEASARIDDAALVFEHNGEDFTEENFAALCRFGRSSKTTLATIGFRGVGFKSAFSLGGRVELHTPTLSVAFDRDRFTEPRWLGVPAAGGPNTIVRVFLKDQYRSVLQENLDEWTKSPVSLLFFKNLTTLEIAGQSLGWNLLENGPVPGSNWLRSAGREGRVLRVLSEQAPFPADAVTEIRQERTIGFDDTDLPPCRVAIASGVPGTRGQLFVVLPTGVETELPFVCDAPFIQDPARSGIKDPKSSPTNRWLLERIGRLAASTLIDWLDRRELAIPDRAEAYSLLPSAGGSWSLGSTCRAIVAQAFAGVVERAPIHMTFDGNVVVKADAVAIPHAVTEIWPDGRAAEIFDKVGRQPLSNFVKHGARARLAELGLLDQLDGKAIVLALQSTAAPKPNTWGQLTALWSFVGQEVGRGLGAVNLTDVRIVPSPNSSVLHAARGAVRLAEGRLLESDDDWSFLSEHIRPVDNSWLKYLDEGVQTVAIQGTKYLLHQVSLDQTTPIGTVVQRASVAFFGGGTPTLQACVRFSRIVAKLGGTAGDGFSYFAKDGRLREPTKNPLVFDPDGTVEELMPVVGRDGLLLHPAYEQTEGGCTKDEWTEWVRSERSGLLTFVPTVPRRMTFRSVKTAEAEASRRGMRGKLKLTYKHPNFALREQDFEPAYWDHWDSLAGSDTAIWSRILRRILRHGNAFIKKVLTVSLRQIGTTGNEISALSDDETLAPSWVIRFRGVRCLPDDRGVMRIPAELFRLTPQTAPLSGAVPFVDPSLDREATRPVLDMLGVQALPPGPDRLIERLKALSKASKPPLAEVDRLYGSLDELATQCSTDMLRSIRRSLSEEPLVLTEAGIWSTSGEVFLCGDGDASDGFPAIRRSVRDLALWRRVGVSDQPDPEKIVAWLSTTPRGVPLSEEHLRRLEVWLARYPCEIWEQGGAWLNAGAEWVPTERLEYALARESAGCKQLFPWVKERTADLRGVPTEAREKAPFLRLRSLDQCMEHRLVGSPTASGPAETRDWLSALGRSLERVAFEAEAEVRMRALATKLRRTSWLPTKEVMTSPHIDGVPAGAPRRTDVLWEAETMYVEPASKARLAKRVPEEIARVFAHSGVMAAAAYAFERSPADVIEYVSENFAIGIAEESVPPDSSGITRSSAEEGAPVPKPGGSSGVESDGTASSENRGPETESGGRVPARSPVRGQGTWVPASPRQPHAAVEDSPSVISVFAQRLGFAAVAPDRFVHRDGRIIGRSSEVGWAWEQRGRDGLVLGRYWPRNHCLERAPLELAAEVWGWIQSRPSDRSLLLTDEGGTPVEIAGSHLNRLLDERRLVLSPATYRLFRDARQQ